VPPGKSTRLVATARSSPFSWRSRVPRRRRPTDHDRGAVAALAALAAAPRGARRAPPRPDEAAPAGRDGGRLLGRLLPLLRADARVFPDDRRPGCRAGGPRLRPLVRYLLRCSPAVQPADR